MADDEFEDGEDYVPSYPWSKDHVTLDALEFAATIAEAAAGYLRQLSFRAGASSNHGIEQKLMHAEAAQEIESLTNPEE